MKEVKTFQQMHRDGLINRREFLAAMGALGVTAATAGGLLTSAGALASTPTRGGSVVFASNLHGPDDTLDPLLGTSTIDYVRANTSRNGLIQIWTDMSLHGELAEEWSVNANATEYVFKIRQGVEFHDGSALTADDVVWSMNRHIAEGSPSSIGSFFTNVTEWKAVDKYTVKLTLSSPDSDMPYKLTQPQAKIVRTDNPLVGSGPYLIDEFQAGVKSTHSRNPNYWRDTGQHLDSIEITAITDPNARLNALLAGSVDMITAINPQSIEKIESTDGYDVLSVPAGLYGGICCLKNTAPGDNDDLVEGLRFIQDRERIVRKFLKGQGTVGNDHPINVSYGADHCHELPQRPYDPDKAKWHLNKSGYTTAELWVAPVIGFIEDACLLMQANLKKIGFDLKLKKVPTDGYWGAVWMKEPLNVVAWNMRPTANAMMGIQFGPGGNWNDTFWNSDRMGELLKDSLAETDPVKRHEMHCEMQKLVSTQSGIIIPAHTNVLDAHNSKVQGFSNVPLGQFGGNGWAEHIWREA
jgi:peptide/nickel transport system substrate-binding protein